MKPILIIANLPSPNTQRLFDAVTQGVNFSGMDALSLTPAAAHAEHVLQASAIIIGTTENFGYMSGAIKDFFERIYYPCLEQTQGLPMALYIKAGLDGTGAKNSVERITSGLRWRLVQEPLILKGEFRQSFVDACTELGTGIGEGVKLGIF